MERRESATLVWLERLPFAADRPLIGYGWSTLIIALAAGLREAAARWMPVGYPFVGFFPAVILTCFLFGRRAGVYAAILCGLIAWYRFIPPAYSIKFDAQVALSLLFYAAVVVVDIWLIDTMQRFATQLVRERERSRRLAETRETLFRELQHRVSNNIQMVGALLSLQKREVADPAARGAIDEAARRLGTIGRLHRQLHDPQGAVLGLGRFLHQICEDVVDGCGHPGVRCTVEVDEALVLDPDRAIPVALIVAESVANAIEHGFAGRERGTIRVRMDGGAAGEGQRLLIIDDGAGVAADFSVERHQGLGLEIVSSLARQIGGEFMLAPAPGGGTEARLDLPAGVSAGPPAEAGSRPTA